MKLVLWAPRLSRPLVAARLAGVEGTTTQTVASEAEAVDAISEADALIIGQRLCTPPIGAAVRAAPGLKWMQLLNAGYDRIPSGTLPDGILVTTAGPGLAPTVAEHALALLLALGRRLVAQHQSQMSGTWDLDIKETLFSLYDKTVAVVGFGPIGQEIARRAGAFGARVVAVSRSGAPSPLAEAVHKSAALPEVLGFADAAVLALPKTPATQGLFDAKLFEACRHGLWLVNVGRGSVIDQEALMAALATGRLAGAALDVTDPEPLPPEHPLWRAPNLLITPHNAAGGGYDRLGAFLAENVRRYMRGESLPSQVRL